MIWKRAFGDDAVFRDIDDIAPELTSSRHLQTRSNACAVLLAVIGPAWLGNFSSVQRAATQRLTMSSEIETALSSGIKVSQSYSKAPLSPMSKAHLNLFRDWARLQGHSQNDKSCAYDLGLLLPRLEAPDWAKSRRPVQRGSAWLRSLRQSPVKLVSRRSGAIAAAAGGGLVDHWRHAMDGAGSISGRRCRVPDPSRADRRVPMQKMRWGLLRDPRRAESCAARSPHFDICARVGCADDFDRYCFDHADPAPMQDASGLCSRFHSYRVWGRSTDRYAKGFHAISAVQPATRKLDRAGRLVA